MIRRLRLLPIVIAAIAALLMLKTIGLVTEGHFVLAGTTPVQAAGGGGEGEGGGGGDPTVEPTAPETVATDTAPTATDTSAAAGAAGGGGHGAPTAEHGAATDTHAAPAAAEAPAAEADIEAPCQPMEPVSDVTPVTDPKAADSHGGEAAKAADSHGGETAAKEDAAAIDFAKLMEKCRVDAGTTPEGDALPIVQESGGGVVPMAETVPQGAEAALDERLAARRADLASMEDEIASREALLKAAEERIKEREASLAALEAKIAGVVDQKAAAEAEQIKQVVAMYETMKPKAAALIFDGLDEGLLVKVAKAMSPKKLAPILAAMDPLRAGMVTAGLAEVDDPAAALAGGPADTAQLPQIVGQ